MKNRLRELRESRNLYQKDIATILNIAVSTYSYWEKGTYEPDQNSLTTLADYFGVSVDYILGRESNQTLFSKYPNLSPITKQRIPMLGKIACGKPTYASEDRESYIMTGTEIDADFCLTASGDSMVNARILDGDIVFCREQSTVDNGDIAAVIIGEEATLKRVYYYPEKKKLVLQAENPKYEPLIYINEELEEIRIIGKAIAFQSDVR